MQHIETSRFRTLIILSGDAFPAYAEAAEVPYSTLTGCYKGQVETSYLVFADDLTGILKSGILAGQNSLLVLSPQEPVTGGLRSVLEAVISADGTKLMELRFLGEWRKVSARTALDAPSWSFDHFREVFWLASREDPA